jgi:hypothetical protein
MERDRGKEIYIERQRQRAKVVEQNCSLWKAESDRGQGKKYPSKTRPQ